jgi:lipoprotein
MKRQLTSILLFSALLVGGASTFVSCTDHESDSAYDTSVSQIAKLTELNEWLGELKETNPDLKSAIDARIQANMNVIKDGVFADKERIEAAIQGSEAYQNLKGKVDGVDGRLQAIEKLRLTDSIAAKKITDALNNRLDSVSGSLDKALNSLVEQKLDGITVNATENPVTGYWNASFTGLNLKLASSFYGVAAEGNEDWDVKANQVLGKGGNAGYLYVSLNPTEIDPSLVKVELVNSQGEPAKGFELGEIDNTDKVLTFGTKAATVSANGFYQVPVIASDPQNDGVEFDKGALAAAAKNALNELRNPKENDLDLSMIASALYKNIPVLTAYGVKAEYYLYNPNTETLELTKTVKHAVSDYDIAAFAVKPVSFNFLKDNATLDKLSDWAVENFRLPSLSSKLNKFADALDVKVTLSADKQKVNVYTIVALTDVKVHYEEATNEAWFEKQDGTKIEGSEIKNVSEVEVIASPETGESTQNVYKITTTDSTIADVVAELNSQIAGKLQPIKNDINKVGDKWENVIAKVNPLLKKVASKIGSANKLLQPTILYVDQNGNPNTLSTIGGRLGTRFVGTGATTLYATSWTAELLAPAYKKSISVLEKGATVTLTDGTSAAEPFAGSVNKVIFNATKAGKYTIVYKAIDYSGVEVEKTFNVVVE